MEHGNIKLTLQPLFNFKAAGRAYILKVDSAEGGRYGAHRGDDFFGILRRKAYGKAVHAAEALEKRCLALHNGHARHAADVTETEHCGAIRNNGHKMTL